MLKGNQYGLLGESFDFKRHPEISILRQRSAFSFSHDAIMQIVVVIYSFLLR